MKALTLVGALAVQRGRDRGSTGSAVSHAPLSSHRPLKAQMSHLMNLRFVWFLFFPCIPQFQFCTFNAIFDTLGELSYSI